MVRNYKRTSTRQNWPEESMRYVIKEVIEKKKVFLVPQMSIIYHTLHCMIKLKKLRLKILITTLQN